MSLRTRRAGTPEAASRTANVGNSFCSTREGISITRKNPLHGFVDTSPVLRDFAKTPAASGRQSVVDPLAPRYGRTPAPKKAVALQGMQTRVDHAFTELDDLV